MASLADLADDDVLWDCLQACITIGMEGWLHPLGAQQSDVDEGDGRTRRMARLSRHLVEDATLCRPAGQGCRQHIARLKAGAPKNMLDDLPDTFSEAQLEALRLQLGKSKEGTSGQLRKWLFRKFIEYSNQTGLYTKTETYLNNA